MPQADTYDIASRANGDYLLGTTSLGVVKRFAGSGRELLTGARTLYVNTAGSDDNDGLTVGQPLLTPQLAMDVLLYQLDLAGQNGVIQLADGTYSTGIFAGAAQTGGGTIFIKGNAADTSAVEITGPSAHVGDGNDGSICLHRGSFFVQDLKVSAPVDGLHISAHSYVGMSNMVFGACGYNQIDVDTFSYLWTGDNYEIVAGAINHAAVTTHGFFQTYGGIVTLTGTPAFSTAFVYLEEHGDIQNIGGSFSGNATGKRHLVKSTCGTISTSGQDPLTFFPGDVAGTVESGGQFS